MTNELTNYARRLNTSAAHVITSAMITPALLTLGGVENAVAQCRLIPPSIDTSMSKLITVSEDEWDKLQAVYEAALDWRKAIGSEGEAGLEGALCDAVQRVQPGQSDE